MKKTVTIEWAPDKKAGVALSDKALARAKRVDVNRILSKQQQQALGEFAAHKVRGRPRKLAPKKDLKLRLDQDIIAAYKATGKGWQTRMNDALRGFIPHLAT